MTIDVKTRATLIVDALIDAKIIEPHNVKNAIEIAEEEIHASGVIIDAIKATEIIERILEREAEERKMDVWGDNLDRGL